MSSLGAEMRMSRVQEASLHNLVGFSAVFGGSVTHDSHVISRAGRRSAQYMTHEKVLDAWISLLYIINQCEALSV